MARQSQKPKDKNTEILHVINKNAQILETADFGIPYGKPLE